MVSPILQPVIAGQPSWCVDWRGDAGQCPEPPVSKTPKVRVGSDRTAGRLGSKGRRSSAAAVTPPEETHR